MKTMTNLKMLNVLSKSELKALRGGKVELVCFCGFNSAEANSIKVDAPSLEDALYAMADLCNGKGATCNGR